uniref:SCAN domain-containing protein 3-like n=1 Tax=Styela clava TaxID=7725 RepID=UPI00193AC3D5|nr:SCAN domain-containing protein 3-like [Styela clava]
MLFAIDLPADTRAMTVFTAVERFYNEKKIPLQNILQCATDGAAAMVGKHRGFIALMRRKIPGLIATHCVIHRQHLVARNLSAELHDALHIAIKCINKIKANSLNDRLFRVLCHDNEEDFECLLLHTAVRWLSKGACMTRFYSLYDSVVEFLSGVDFQLAESLIPLKNDIAYLADIFSFMNEVNKKLQDEMITLIRCKSVLTSFISKLSLYKDNMGRNTLSQFPNLCENNVTENERLKYCARLQNLVEDMNIRFEDLISLTVPRWIVQPFSAEPADLKVELQDQFIDLLHDEESKMDFTDDRYDVFWCRSSSKYPTIFEEVEPWILSFPTSYMVEKGFSAVTLLLSKQRNRLSITKRGDLRLFLTKMSPKIKKLAEEHQAHPSH